MTDAELRMVGDVVLLNHPRSHEALEHFMVQRLVTPSIDLVQQFAFLLFIPDLRQPPLEPDGMAIPEACRDRLPPQKGQRLLEIHDIGAEPALAHLNELLWFLGARECGPGEPEPVTEQRGPVILALEDDRICGYASGDHLSQNAILIESDARGVKADGVAIIPAMKHVKVPVAEIVWVANRHRRGGLGQVLLGRLRAILGVRMAYGLPFTPAGFRMVQRFTGMRFVGLTREVFAISVPLAEEHRLAPCHSRVVNNQTAEESEAMGQRLARAGFALDEAFVRTVQRGR